MNERRKSQRWLLSQYIPVYDNNSDQLIGKIVDLTIEGLRVISDNKIPEYNEYSIRFEAQLTTGETDWVSAQVSSLWSRADINPNFYDTGFIFTDISPITKLAIRDIIENLKFDIPD